MKKRLAVVISLFLSALSFASGIITLDGKFYGKTDKNFMILMNDQVYTIEKSKISATQSKYLGSLKFEEKLSVSVAMDSIKDVHDKK